MLNLDFLAAQTSQTIVEKAQNVKELENLATKCLGVLQENGVYALWLFLKSRKRSVEENLAKILLEHLRKVYEEIYSLSNTQQDAKWILNITEDLDQLLLIKQVWEQTLIYVRYTAKARKGDGSSQRE